MDTGRQEAGRQGGGQELLSAASSTPPCIHVAYDGAGSQPLGPALLAPLGPSSGPDHVGTRSHGTSSLFLVFGEEREVAEVSLMSHCEAWPKGGWGRQGG